MTTPDLSASSSLRSALTTAVQTDAAARGFTLDGDQSGVLEHLVRLAEQLIAQDVGDREITDAPHPRSVYVWGDSGRGKSWLLNSFFAALPVEAKRRVHFHAFFRQVHAGIQKHRDGLRPGSGQNSVHVAVGDLIKDVEVLYFDEFHVHDPADALLLTRLLDDLFARDIVLLASSNYSPQALMPNPTWHESFAAGIRSIEANMDLLELNGAVDYRATAGLSIAGFASGSWLSPGSDEQLAEIGLTAPAAGEQTKILVRTRQFDVRAARENELWVTFADIARARTTPIEYLDWIERFPIWVITEVPLLQSVDMQSQQRFINIIDVLSDADTALVILSEHPLAEFLANASGGRDWFRMTSRLQLLRPSTTPISSPTDTEGAS
jgi:cell division protein ZapE